LSKRQKRLRVDVTILERTSVATRADAAAAAVTAAKALPRLFHVSLSATIAVQSLLLLLIAGFRRAR